MWQAGQRGFEASFTIDKETKNTVRYSQDEDGTPPQIGTLYIQKWALGGAPYPARLVVIVKDGEDGAR